MYDIIPLVLILVSLGVIIIIVTRKFSILASLDVENIPAEREAKVKEQIISSRLKRNLVKWTSKITKLSKFVFEKLSLFFEWLHKKLLEAKDIYKKEDLEKKPIDKGERIKELFVEIEELLKQENNPEAEKKIIDIIGLDSKNIKAFKILANLYFENGNHNEAIQTYEHILKLISENPSEESEAEIYFDIALINKAKEDLDKAIENLKQALKIQPSNPRYLDTLLETSIINKDKVTASDAYDKLKEANSENNKLEEFKIQIEKL